MYVPNKPKIEEVRIPYNFEPREYQVPFMQALDEGYKRFVLVWHRRAGKDKACIAIVPKILMKTPGLAVYVFPTLKQGREVLWEGRDNDGFRFLDHIPKELRAKDPNESRMTIELTNGSLFRVAGADNPDSLRGGNGTLYIFSEWPMHDPDVWSAVVQPIVESNKGIAIFNYTPLGKNHGYDTYKYALAHEDKWFTQVLTVNDTKTISEAVLGDLKQEYYDRTGDDALFQQEFYCSFDSPIQGAYYGKWMNDAQNSDPCRITDVAWEPKLLVSTWWDIGRTDSTAIWFTQQVGNTIRLIDYYENSGEDLSHYVKVISERGPSEGSSQKYNYASHNAPHDIKVTEWTAKNKSRWEIARSLGIRFNVLPRTGLYDGIEITRETLPRCWFDKTKCERGINALKEYQKRFNSETKSYSEYPLKSWACHGADAFRMMSLGMKTTIRGPKKEKKVNYRRLFRRRSNPLAGM